MRALSNRLFEPVDHASLIFFRVAFGVILFGEAVRYLALGLARELYIEPNFHFTYFGFEWVRPWPGPDAWPSFGMDLHLAILAVLGVLVAAGLFYRIATTLFFFGFTYVFLLDQARYLNHFYLVCLLAFLMIFLPAHRGGSIDARRRLSLTSQPVPAWAIWLLRAQLGIVYFYAGVAKLNADWLQGQPLLMWLDGREDFPPVEPHQQGLDGREDFPVIGALISQDWVAYAMSYGGVILDLAAAPLLLWRRTRSTMFVIVLLFHLTNAVVFSIGIFPWLMIAATSIFFEPDWPRRVRWSRWRSALTSLQQLLEDVAERLEAPLARLRLFDSRDAPAAAVHAAPPAPTAIRRWLVVTGLAFYLIVQVLVPLRHFLYPGDVNWTDEGHRFSWRMKLRSKRGWARFVVRNPASGETWTIDPATPESSWRLTPRSRAASETTGETADEEAPGYLTPRQVRKMAGLPDMILQFSHHLADKVRRAGHPEVEVRAWVRTALNGRRPRPLVDARVDLAAQPRTLWPQPWILPLTEPLIRERSTLPSSRRAPVRLPTGRVRKEAESPRGPTRREAGSDPR